MTTAPADIPPRVTASVQPEFLRLPKPGERCPYTGMTRSGLNTLILPNPLNGGRPLVRSFTLRRKGSKFGTRLIDFADLCRYVRQHEQEAAV
jgi:hypothetical protein